jgi:Dolichyl-phosphate-mannose-protein mannosyltransferase
MIVERREVGAYDAGLKVTALAALTWTILAFGALLRLVWYFDRGSLWLDEAFLALNIVHRSPAELLERLSFDQGAPWGFLLAEKLSVATLGVDELSLRLVPLLAALASLPVFWRVASFYLEGRVLLLSLLLFSLSPQLIRYSAEVKQYSVDVFASLLALWLLHSARQLANWRRAAAAGMGGALLLWFSHASMIVLGAGGLVLGAAALVRRQWWDVRRLAVVGAAWASSAAAFFLLAWPTLRKRYNDLFAGAREYTAPVPPENLGDAWVLARQAGDVIEGAFGFLGRPWSTLIIVAAALLIVAGGFSLARRDRVRAALLVAPLVAAAVAVAADLYPFAIRFLLFLVPLELVLVAAGTSVALAGPAGRRRHRRAIAGVGVIATAWLIVAASVASTRTFTQTEQDIEPVLVDLRAAWRPGDVLYLHAESQYAARFYAEVDGLNRSSAGEVLWPVMPTSGPTAGAPALRSAPPTLVVGQKRPRGWTFVRDLAALDGRKRVWFVFSHVINFEGSTVVDPLDRYIATLDAAGTRRLTIRHSHAMALLYDLRG